MNLVAPPPYPRSQTENRSSGRMGKSAKKLSSRTLSIESNNSSEDRYWTAALGAKIGQPPVQRKPKNQLRRQSSERNQRSPRKRDKPRRRSSHTASSSRQSTKIDETRKQVVPDSFAGDAFPDIVQVMRRASNEIKKALRRDLLSRFKQTPAYVHANNHKEAFWFEAIPATPGDWSCFKGLPTSGYSKFYSYATKEEYGTYLNFLTASRELESLERQTGEYRYLLKFYEIFTSFIDAQLPSDASNGSISLGGNKDDEASTAAGLAEMKIEMGSEVIKSLEKAHARYFGSSLDRVMASDDEHEGMLIFEAKGWYSSDDSMF